MAQSYDWKETKARAEAEKARAAAGLTRRKVITYDSKNSFLEKKLHITICAACEKPAVVLSEPLSMQPKRGTDGSSAIKQALIVKSMMIEGDTKMIKRQKGVEKQYRWKCPGCDLTLCYQSTPFDSTTKFLFAMAGALTTHEDDLGQEPETGPGGAPARKRQSRGESKAEISMSLQWDSKAAADQ